MKKLLLLFVISLHLQFTEKITALNPGDILFTGVNSETAAEGFSFIAMVAIPAGTVIKFTDNPYSGTTLGTGEGTLTWTAPAGGIASGTQIAIFPTSTAVSTPTASSPAGTGTSTWTGNFALVNSSDQILAYQGTGTSPSFLAGISVSASWLTTGAAGSNTSYLPSSIVNYSVALPTLSIGNVAYTSNISGSAAQILAALTSATGWTSSGVSTTAQTLPPSGIVLPITIKSFNISNQTLFFSTATESQNSHFEIERSQNGKDFASIGRVEGSGNSTTTQKYQFEDKNQAQGFNYYRLKQVDFDGRFEYSKIISTYVGKKNLDANIISEQSEQLKINIQSTQNQDANINIIDMNGRLIANYSVFLEKDKNEITLDTNLQNGMYVIRISVNNGAQISKLLSIK